MLVVAINGTMIDAKDKIKPPLELEQKFENIKVEQLLGIEILSNIYMLAILNIILVKKGL